MLTSESSTRDDLRVPPEKGMLYISIDGMDQVSLLQQHPDSNLIQSISFWLNGTETRLLSSSKTIQIGRILAFCCSPELRRSTNVPETFLSPKNFRRHSAHPSTWWDVWSMGCARSTSYATMMFPRAQTPTWRYYATISATTTTTFVNLKQSNTRSSFPSFNRPLLNQVEHCRSRRRSWGLGAWTYRTTSVYKQITQRASSATAGQCCGPVGLLEQGWCLQWKKPTIG
jgi:hypothetical protein